MTTIEHTPTAHMLDEAMTLEEAFEVFRKEYNSIKCFVESNYMVYGPFDRRFAHTSLETCNAIIRRKRLPLKASAEYLLNQVTIIIEVHYLNGGDPEEGRVNCFFIGDDNQDY